MKKLIPLSFLLLSTHLFADAIKCDNVTAHQKRTRSAALYKSGDYNGAYSQLNNFLKQCNKLPDQLIILWMKNDLALYAIKSQPNTECHKIIYSIQNDREYASASPALTKSVDFNDAACLAKVTDQDQMQWAFQQKLITKYQMKKLIQQAVPAINVSFSADVNVGFANFQDEVIFYALQSINSKSDGRYVTAEGQWQAPGGGQDFGGDYLVWIDLLEKRGMALGLEFSTNPEERPDAIKHLIVASNNINTKNISTIEKNIIAAFLKEEINSTGNKIKAIDFYEGNTNSPVTLPLTWLN